MDQGIGIVPLCPNRQEHLEVLVLKPSGEALRLPTYGFWGGLKVVTRTSMDGTTEAVPCVQTVGSHLEVLVLKPSAEALRLPTRGSLGV